ncbi:MAG: catalase [Deltaproteobacteria bacterium]|nr:catalase [Deltaproteobacteria bacterium]
MKNTSQKLVPLALSVALFSSCSSAPDSSRTVLKTYRDPSAAPKQPAAELGESWGADDEANSSEAVSHIEKMLVARTGGSALMKRDAHPKHHGCVTAVFKIDSKALPAKNRVGVYAHDGDEFKAWVRFSNGDPDSTKPDTDGDVRGMAVKLMGVPETNFLTQAGVESTAGIVDFVMMNSPVFFIKNSADYAALMRSLDTSTAALLWFMATHPSTAIVLQKARGMKVGNPLHLDYFSATPYRFGPDVGRFKFASCVPLDKRDKRAKKAGPDYLRERLVASLGADEACFDVYARIASAHDAKLVENPMKPWNLKKSPYVKVARLTIPKQTGIDSEPQLAFCENVNFNPWRTPPENRPLGAINRVRLQAYGQISDLRHGHNRVPQLQPKDHDVCTGETAPLCRKL